MKIYTAINKEDGSKKSVDEAYVRKALSGNYKDIDLAIETLNEIGVLQTMFQIFKTEQVNS